MDKKYQSHYFLFLALGVSIVVMYFIAKPFLGPLILAAVFAYIFQPIYNKFLYYINQFRNNKNSQRKIPNEGKKLESLAAFFTTIISIILVLLPILFIGIQIFKESSQLYQSLSSESGGFIGSVENIINQASAILPISTNFELDFGQYAKQGLEVLIHNFGTVFSSFAKLLLNAFLFLIAFYFFLKDGSKLKNYFVALSPLDDTDDEFIVSRLKSAVSAAVKGNITIGLIQGTLTGIGFA